MPATPPSLDSELTSFLAGDDRAGAALYKRLKVPLLRQVRRHAPDLPRDIAEEAVTGVFVLMMENRNRFDPARGTAQAFISATLLPEAVRRIRADNAQPGQPKRHRKPGTTPLLTPATGLDDVPEAHAAGYGSASAMEAACDARLIWSRATPPMRLIIGGLMDGKKQGEIAADIGMNRFQVARMVAGLQRQFMAVA